VEEWNWETISGSITSYIQRGFYRTNPWMLWSSMWTYTHYTDFCKMLPVSFPLFNVTSAPLLTVHDLDLMHFSPWEGLAVCIRRCRAFVFTATGTQLDSVSDSLYVETSEVIMYDAAMDWWQWLFGEARRLKIHNLFLFFHITINYKISRHCKSPTKTISAINYMSILTLYSAVLHFCI